MPLGIEGLARAVTKRARRGLYAGKKVLSGNNISEDGGNKTRRAWKPNAQSTTLYSELLNESIKLRVTTTALRTIDKVGGLDRYLLQTPTSKLDSSVGEALRLRMIGRLIQGHEQTDVDVK